MGLGSTENNVCALLIPFVHVEPPGGAGTHHFKNYIYFFTLVLCLFPFFPAPTRIVPQPDRPRRRFPVRRRHGHQPAAVAGAGPGEAPRGRRGGGLREGGPEPCFFSLFSRGFCSGLTSWTRCCSSPPRWVPGSAVRVRGEPPVWVAWPRVGVKPRRCWAPTSQPSCSGS